MNQYNVYFDDGMTEIVVAYGVNFDVNKQTALFDLGKHKSLFLTHVAGVELVG